MKAPVRILKKVALWTAGILVALVLLAYILIRLPAVHEYARGKSVTFLREQLGTPVEVAKLRIVFPKQIVLEGVYFEDQQGDTLFAGEKLTADISMWRLLRNTIQVNKLALEGITANVTRNADSVYNFQYIIDSLSSTDETPKEEASQPMSINLRRLTLDRITANYSDVPSAMEGHLRLGHLGARVRDFNLTEQQFYISELDLSNTTGSFSQHKPPASPESEAEDEAEATAPIPFDIDFGTVSLDNVRFDYDNAVSQITANLDFGTLRVTSDDIDLPQQRISLDELVMKQSSIAVMLGATGDAEVLKAEAKKEVETQSQTWEVHIAEVDFQDNAIQYDDRSVPPAETGIDFAHPVIRNFNLQANELSYIPETFSARVTSASLTEKSGLVLNQLKGEFLYTPNTAYAKDLLLETAESTLRGNIEIQYENIDSIVAHPGSLIQETTLANSTVAMQDVLLFVPELADNLYFRRIANDILSVDAQLDGKLNDLRIEKLDISGLSHTQLNASGTIKGLPDAEHATFDLRIGHLDTRRSDLLAILPDSVLPQNITLPEEIHVNGVFRGDLREFYSDLNFNTSEGNGTLTGTFGLDTPMHFDGKIRIENFNAGKVLQQDTILGRITLEADAVVRNMDTDSISGTFSGLIREFGFQGYTYHDIAFEGEANSGRIEGIVTAENDHLEMTLNGTITLGSASSPAAQFQLDLAHADLGALHLTDQRLRIGGIMKGDFSSIDPDSLNGTVDLLDLMVADSARTVRVDSMHLVSTATSDEQSLKLTSDFLDVSLSGEYEVTTLFPALSRSVSKYLAGAPDTVVVSSEPQDIAFSGQISYSPLFTQFDSNLTGFSPIDFNGSYQSEGDQLELTATTERIQYKPTTISGLELDLGSQGQGLQYSVSVDDARSGEVRLYGATLEGGIENNVIDAALNVLDSAGKERFHLVSEIQRSDGQYIITLDPEDLVLDYDRWSVSPDNQITITPEGIAARNFVLSNGDQELSARSEPYGINSPLALEFRNFRLGTITEIISQDSLLAGGTLEGTAVVRDIFTNPVFTADLSVTDFSYQGDTVGNIQLNVDNETANTLAAKATITGGGNEVSVQGRYSISSQTIDLNIDLARLRLASAEAFSQGYFTDAEGLVKGDLHVGGTLTGPIVAGDLLFDSASLHIPELNATYTLAREGMSFNESDIHFKDFTITDEENNTLDVNGIIYTRTFTNFSFEVDIVSEGFRVLNTQATGNNDLYYGTLYIDSDIRIRGPLNLPEINADLKVLDRTDMTVIIPQTAPGIVEREGVVRFVDLDDPQLDSVLAVNTDTFNTFSVKGIVAYANIQVTKDSEFKLVIDQASGDFLRLRGNAELNVSIDQSGKISMTGSYILDEGVYELSFNFLKRRFDIRKGSTITWNGEPTSGEIDVTAAYIVEAAPIDLVENQLGEASQTELNLYKEKLPFELLLSLEGTLLEPEVSFEINLPEGNYQVAPEVLSIVRAKLDQLDRDESELNKQAFALVLLNRFIADNPFQTLGGGTSAESYARQSVSKLLSQQLNNLTDDLIAGVDLRFDLESSEDYSTGQLQNRTDLNISASKRLFDDRLTVTVGSNFELEGAKQSKQQSTNIAGDVSVEYQLSRDGRYLLRAYRKNEYEVALEGQVVETGLSFVIQMDYDRFRNIFRRRDDKLKE